MATAPSSAALTEIEQIVGAQNFSSDAASRAAYAVDGVQPAAVARPATQQEAAEIVKRCAADGAALIPCGARTALHIGAPPGRYDLALDLSRLNRVLAYDPADMTLSVEAGTRFADIDKLLAANNQFLPLAAPRFEDATVGGTLAANLSGPVRHAYGTARDLLLGADFVTGEGIAAKSGGRVVKNVAGLDVHKLLIGSLGTLGVITTANFRTFPQQPVRESFVLSCAAREAALRLLPLITASPLTLEALDLASPDAALRIDPGGNHLPHNRWSIVASAAGVAAVVARIHAELGRLASEVPGQDFRALSSAHAAAVWRGIRDFPSGECAADAATLRAVVKCSVLPSEFAALLGAAEQMSAQHQIAAASLVRAGSVVYIALRADSAATERLAAAVGAIRAAVTPAGGRAVLETGDAGLKRHVDVWGPPAQDHALMRRVKTVFDPRGILSPGRFVGGI